MIRPCHCTRCSKETAALTCVPAVCGSDPVDLWLCDGCLLKNTVGQLKAQLAAQAKALAVCKTALQDISRDAWFDVGARGRIIATTADGALATLAAIAKERVTS